MGTGTVTLPPDIAYVTATVETYDGHSASVAVSANSEEYGRLASAVVAVGIPRSDITLTWYNVSYTAPPNSRSGYTVDRMFNVEVHRLSLAGSVIDAASQAGATNIGVYFGLANGDAANQEALQRAVEDAAAKATAVASAAHLHIVAVSRVQVGDVAIPQATGTAGQLYAAYSQIRVPTQLDTGNTTVSQTVTIIYLAKP